MSELVRECETFNCYLIGEPPTEYVRKKYEYYHALPNAPRFNVTDRFDKSVLALARLHPVATQIADAYCRWFRRRSVLRKKLFLMLAILECCAPSYRAIDAVDSGRRLGLAARFAGHIGLALLVHLIAVALLLPWHLICIVTDAVGSRVSTGGAS